MGHQSPERPNQPSGLVLLGSDHIPAHHRGPSHQLSTNVRRHLWAQDLPEFTHGLGSCVLADQSLWPEGTATEERDGEPDRPRKTSMA